MAKPIGELLEKALHKVSSTETTEPTTMATPKSIETLASWMGLKTFNDPQLTAMVVKIGQWVKRIKTGGEPCILSLIGYSDTGKTHCAERLAPFLYGRPEWSRTIFIPEIIRWPKQVEAMRNGSYWLFHDIQAWPFLVVDEILSERDPTGFSADKLCTLIGARTRHWTLLTGNITFDRIAEIDERIASRLVRNGGLVVECKAKPYSTR